MVLVVVGQTVVHVHFADEIAVQLEIDAALAVVRVVEHQQVGARPVGGHLAEGGRIARLTVGVVDDVFAHLVREVQQRNANGNECDADDEERW